MHIKIKIRKVSKKPLHYDYQYDLRSMLINSIAKIDIELSNKLHGKGIKFYTFSKILINGHMSSSKDGLNFDIANFIISSPDDKLIKSFAEGILQKQTFELNCVKFIIEEMRLLSPPKLGNLCTFKSISPVLVRSKNKDLYPIEDKKEFCRNLQNILFTRYEKFYGHKPESDEFEITNIHDVKKKRVAIKNTNWRCSDITFTLRAHPDVIKFAYEAGVGSKPNMGFGCVRTL